MDVNDLVSEHILILMISDSVAFSITDLLRGICGILVQACTSALIQLELVPNFVVSYLGILGNGSVCCTY